MRKALSRPLVALLAASAVVAPAGVAFAAEKAPTTTRDYVGATLQTYVHGTLFHVQVKDFGTHTEVRGLHEDSERNVSRRATTSARTPTATAASSRRSCPAAS